MPYRITFYGNSAQTKRFVPVPGAFDGGEFRLGLFGVELTFQMAFQRGIEFVSAPANGCVKVNASLLNHGKLQEPRAKFQNPERLLTSLGISASRTAAIFQIFKDTLGAITIGQDYGGIPFFKDAC